MVKEFKNALLYPLLLLMLISVFAILFSPYGKHDGSDYKLVKHSIEINAPAKYVYEFLGNSDNASRWSVYVHHISILNADSVPDGSVGSLRRCFSRADETGRIWDEETVEVIRNEKRRLTIFNQVGFGIFTAENLATEQIYKKLSDEKCELTFTVFFTTKNPGFWNTLKMYFAAYKIKSIFEGNMNNIKRIVEEEYKSE